MFVLPDDIEFSRHLSITEKSCIRALARHCGSKDVCWPGLERIGRYMNRSVRTVQRTLKRLIELKLVEVIPRSGKSNLYRVLCLEVRQAINTHDTIASSEQNISCTRKRSNGTGVGTFCYDLSNSSPSRRRDFHSPNLTKKMPAEIALVVNDIGEIMGHHVAAKNRGWFWKLAKMLPDDWLYSSLSWVQEAMLYGEVRSPSALLTWKLRTEGAEI